MMMFLNHSSHARENLWGLDVLVNAKGHGEFTLEPRNMVTSESLCCYYNVMEHVKSYGLMGP